jgi:hypothetical protein
MDTADNQMISAYNETCRYISSRSIKNPWKAPVLVARLLCHRAEDHEWVRGGRVVFMDGGRR